MYTETKVRQILDRYRHTHPGQDGEEAESDGGSGGVGALGQWQLVWRGRLPLIGQETEADEPQEACKTWRRDAQGSEKRQCAAIYESLETKLLLSERLHCFYYIVKIEYHFWFQKLEYLFLLSNIFKLSSVGTTT